MSTEQFHLPDLGEGLNEAEIVAWHVSEGDRVVADQPLLSVETDKAVVEIPAPYSGTVARLHGQVEDRVAVGALLVEIATERSDSGAVVGDLPESAPGVLETGTPVKASPAARKRARELGVRLPSVAASGPDGVVQVTDVERAVGADRGAIDGHAAQPIRGVRRAMARRMADAHARVVPASMTGEADISSWAEQSDVLLRLIRAIGVACVAEPRLNSAFDDREMTLTSSTTVDLGVAMETADGLFVPVLRDIAGRSDSDLAAAVLHMKTDVASRRIPSEALRGQTITVSNFGAVAGIHAAMVVVPPQVAIVGSGRVRERLVMLSGQVVAHCFLPLSITFDHRVVTGVEACRFLDALVGQLENAR